MSEKIKMLRIVKQTKNEVVVKPYTSIMDCFIENENYDTDNRTIEVV